MGTHHYVTPVRRPRAARLLGVLLLLGCGGAPSATAPAPVPPTTDQVARSARGMVVAAQPLATAAGVEMLERGGNAADAAVAAAFAVAVVEPSMYSLGGRTQILVREAGGDFRGIDATTQAPATYDPDTAPQAGYGYPTVGIPGTVAGLTRLLDEHGSLPLATVMEPAIRYASEGFAILPGEAGRQRGARDQLAESEGARAYFLLPDGSTRTAGTRFVQSDLARTLRRIAEGGADEFYRGGIADEIVRDMESEDGHVTREALAAYRAVDARVVRGSYRGYELVGTFTPAAGAMSIGILHILERFDLAGADEATWAAAVGQALALGFQAGREHRGPDAWRTLTSKEWAREQARRIRLPEAVASGGGGGLALSGPADSWGGGEGRAPSVVPDPPPPGVRAAPAPDDDGHTTHLSTADARGMAVSLTQTIGPAMGSKVAAPGLGFLYAATLGGYLGPMQPGERARSNISPLMVLRSMDFEIREVPRDGAFGRIHGLSYDRASGTWTGVADPDWEGSAAAPRR